MRKTAWTLVAVGLFVGWMAVPTAVAPGSEDQCDAKKCEQDPLNGDCSGSLATPCALTDGGRIDCNDVRGRECPDYLSTCQDLTGAGCWAGQLVPPAAPGVDDARDAYSVLLHPGKYEFFMGQNPKAEFIGWDFTMCVYAPGKPVASAPVAFGMESVVVDTSAQPTAVTWKILVKTGPTSCPTGGGSSAGDAAPAAGASAQDDAEAWWSSLAPGRAAACDGLCHMIVGEKGNAYCLGFVLFAE